MPLGLKSQTKDLAWTTAGLSGVGDMRRLSTDIR
jgi:hypothetical protein